jgi:hypothetical protein
MNHGKSEQPPVRRIRVLALLILTWLVLALGLLEKSAGKRSARGRRSLYGSLLGPDEYGRGSEVVQW